MTFTAGTKSTHGQRCELHDRLSRRIGEPLRTLHCHLLVAPEELIFRRLRRRAPLPLVAAQNRLSGETTGGGLLLMFCHFSQVSGCLGSCATVACRAAFQALLSRASARDLLFGALPPVAFTGHPIPSRDQKGAVPSAAAIAGDPVFSKHASCEDCERLSILVAAPPR